MKIGYPNQNKRIIKEFILKANKDIFFKDIAFIVEKYGNEEFQNKLENYEIEISSKKFIIDFNYMLKIPGYHHILNSYLTNLNIHDENKLKILDILFENDILFEKYTRTYDLREELIPLFNFQSSYKHLEEKLTKIILDDKNKNKSIKQFYNLIKDFNKQKLIPQNIYLQISLFTRLEEVETNKIIEEKFNDFLFDVLPNFLSIKNKFTAMEMDEDIIAALEVFIESPHINENMDKRKYNHILKLSTLNKEYKKTILKSFYMQNKVSSK